jgi:hypothetical protein
MSGFKSKQLSAESRWDMTPKEQARLEILVAFQSVSDKFAHYIYDRKKDRERRYKSKEEENKRKEDVLFYKDSDSIIAANMKYSAIEDMTDLERVIRSYSWWLADVIKAADSNVNAPLGSLVMIAAEAAHGVTEQVEECRSLLHIHIAHPDKAIKRAKMIKSKPLKSYSWISAFLSD